MGKVILDITMSIDGFIAGQHPSQEQPMGEGGSILHKWIFAGKTDTDNNLLNELVAASGAVIVGANTYFTAINGAWEGISPFRMPAFVVSHKTPEKQVSGFTFVNEGIADALVKAKETAKDKNIWVMGGAGIARQYLSQGLLDEIHIHIAPVILSAGTRLFEDTGVTGLKVEKMKVTDTPYATHLYLKMIH
jgi:dihydrofolate reductase